MRMDSDDDFDYTIYSQYVVVSNHIKLVTIQDGSSHKLPVIKQKSLQYIQEKN